MKKSSFNLQTQNKNVDDRIVASLERISEVFRVLLWEQSKETGLSPIQIQTLIFLLGHSSNLCKITYLAREFNVTKPTISDTVRVLEEKKLVARLPDPDDTRSQTIQLTAPGRLVAEKTSGFADTLRKSIETIPEVHKSAVLLSLLNIINQLHLGGVIRIQRMCFACRFFDVRKNERNYCLLLKKPLDPDDLRLDCPEFEDKHTLSSSK